MTTLIPADNHVALMAVLFLLVAIAMYLEERQAWARKISAAVLLLIAGLVFSNLRIIPHTAPAFAFVNQYFVAIAIPLVLFKADLKKIVRESGPTFLAFLLAAAGTMTGAVVAYLTVDVPSGAEFAGILTGGYTGGGLNFAAVSQTVGLIDSTLAPAALAAGSVAAILYMVVLAALPSVGAVRRFLPLRGTEEVVESVTPPAGRDAAAPKVNRALHTATALALSVLIVALGNRLAALVGDPGLSVLFVTALAIVAANVAPARMAALEGDMELGMLLLYVFFVVFAAGANLREFAGLAGAMFLFTFVAIAVHFVIVAVGAKLLRFSYAEALTATNACILGPPTAAALAAGRGWHALVTPGILCGVFGYVIGNFLGVTVYAWLS